MNKNRLNIIFIIILIIGIFLRIYRLEETFAFSGEVGDNLLDIKKAYLNGNLPLLGPPTSHPWLYFGPEYYWIVTPLLIVFGFNPMVIAWLGALGGILVIWLNYYVIRKLYSSKTALISSFLIAVSPFCIGLARDARFFSLVLVFFYPFWYNFCKKKLFLTGLFLGLMLSFHYTPLVLVPSVIFTTYILQDKKFVRKVGKFLVGVILPAIPLIIYSFAGNFEMIRNLMIWLPYRMAGFLGFYPKNNLSLDIIIKNLISFYNFITRLVLVEQSPLGFFVLILFVAIVVYFCSLWFKEKLSENVVSLLLFFVFGCVAIFIHGDPPIHYYLPLLPFPIILVSEFISRQDKKMIYNVTGSILIIAFVFVNFSYYFSKQYFFLSQREVLDGYVPYSLQQEISRKIIEDAGIHKFSLSRTGKYDYFEGNYAQNYQYLLWWMGNEPVDDAKLKYTIIENGSYRPKKDDRFFKINDIIVLKENI